MVEDQLLRHSVLYVVKNYKNITTSRDTITKQPLMHSTQIIYLLVSVKRSYKYIIIIKTDTVKIYVS